MEARISGWMIGCGDLAMPVAGETMAGVALRLTSEQPTLSGEPVTVEGTLTWVSFDSFNGQLETVIDAGVWRVLTQESWSAADPLPEVGSRVRARGYLDTVGFYEFDAFCLPDISQSWHVDSVRALDPPNDLVVDLEPLDFRPNASPWSLPPLGLVPDSPVPVWVAFTSRLKHSAWALEDALAARGWAARRSSVTKRGLFRKRLEWTIVGTRRVEAGALTSVDELVKDLEELASIHQSRFDGWSAAEA